MKDGEGEKERKEKKGQKEKTLTHNENFQELLSNFQIYCATKQC